MVDDKEEKIYQNHKATAERGRGALVYAGDFRGAGIPEKFWDRLIKECDWLEYELFYIDRLKFQKVKTDFIVMTTGKDPQWSKATEMLVDYIKDKLKIYTTISDTKSEMWVYDEGVYIPEGKSKIKERLRYVLEERYNIYVLNKVVEKIEPDTFIDPQEFFSQNHKWEIPLENGILNIEKMILLPFNKDKIFFNKLPVKYDEGQTCEDIDNFLKGVLLNEEDVDVFYEMAGFCLLKEYTFEKAFMLVGDGRNGKGKSMELIKRLVGINNCCNIPLTSLIPESFSISELHNKMVNLAGDISNQDLKDTSSFKSCTGRDLLGGKRKFLTDVSFENYAKFIFACNDLPMVYDLSRGFWDRWILLEFPYTFVTKEEYDSTEVKEFIKIKDDNIINKISTKEQMSGFLNMCLLALHRLINNKRFSSSTGTEEIKSTWIKRSNSFIAFCYDHIEENYDAKIHKKDMRKYFAKYCKIHKISPKSDYVVKRILQETYGASEERFENLGKWDWFWTGIKFKNLEVYT